MFCRRIDRRTEVSMKPIAPLVAIAAALVLMLTTIPSSGQPVLNPTASDINGNTVGGTDAFKTCLGKTAFPCVGVGNTAFGDGALFSNTIGTFNTATGNDALVDNTTGVDNTAIGNQALFRNTTGEFNTATGSRALLSNTTDIANTTSG